MSTELVARATPGGGTIVAITVRGTELFNYDRMLSAINECHRVDEVKGIRDRAVALQAYARQAGNTEAELQVTRIRLRAEYRAGRLLAEMEKATGGDAQRTRFHKGTESPPKLAELGISKKQSWIWQQLASIPEEAFQDFLSSEGKLNAYRVVRAFAAIASHEGFPLSGRWWEPEKVTWDEDLKRAPEFVQENFEPLKAVKVNFETREAMEAFARLVGQTITMNTQAIWYPKIDIAGRLNNLTKES